MAATAIKAEIMPYINKWINKLLIHSSSNFKNMNKLWYFFPYYWILKYKKEVFFKKQKDSWGHSNSTSFKKGKEGSRKKWQTAIQQGGGRSKKVMSPSKTFLRPFFLEHSFRHFCISWGYDKITMSNNEKQWENI